jgi:hypothetical protein
MCRMTLLVPCSRLFPLLDEAAAALDRAGQIVSAHLAAAERVSA